MDRARDPSNQWLWAVPLTEAELAEDRRAVVDLTKGMYDDAPDRYTCDDCPMARRCTLAFDVYNVNGDCLYEK